jgi:hypothetical protein
MIDLRLAKAMTAVALDDRQLEMQDYQKRQLALVNRQSWLNSTRRQLLQLVGLKLASWGEWLQQRGLPPTYA